MPSEKIRVLFCDNEPPHHADFVRWVVSVLKREFPRFQIQVEHSQSLEELEDEFSPNLRRSGARSVRTFLSRKICAWELVITDLDFASENEMGSHTTGFDIIETVYERSQQEFPWCEFLVFSAVAESMPPERYVATARILKNNPDSLIRLGTKSVAEKSWHQMAGRAVVLLKDALRMRTLSLGTGSATVLDQSETPGFPPRPGPTFGSVPGETRVVEYNGGVYKPNIYEIVLLRSKSEQKVCLVVWPKDQPERRFRIVSEGLEMYTLLALSANCSGFISLRDLAPSAKEQAGRGVFKGFTEDAVKQHVEKIRGWFAKDPVLLETGPNEATQAWKLHKGKHRQNEICGYCVLYSRPGVGGYALGGNARTIEIPEDAWIDKVFEDPIAAIARYEKATAAGR